MQCVTINYDVRVITTLEILYANEPLLSFNAHLGSSTAADAARMLCT